MVSVFSSCSFDVFWYAADVSKTRMVDLRHLLAESSSFCLLDIYSCLSSGLQGVEYFIPSAADCNFLFSQLPSLWKAIRQGKLSK